MRINHLKNLVGDVFGGHAVDHVVLGFVQQSTVGCQRGVRQVGVDITGTHYQNVQTAFLTAKSVKVRLKQFSLLTLSILKHIVLAKAFYQLYTDYT